MIRRPPSLVPDSERMAQDRSGTVERTIHFFRADVGLGAAGQPLGLDIEPVLKVIDRLAFRESERYVELDDGNLLSCVVDSTPAWPSPPTGDRAAH